MHFWLCSVYVHRLLNLESPMGLLVSCEHLNNALTWKSTRSFWRRGRHRHKRQHQTFTLTISLHLCSSTVCSVFFFFGVMSKLPSAKEENVSQRWFGSFLMWIKSSFLIKGCRFNKSVSEHESRVGDSKFNCKVTGQMQLLFTHLASRVSGSWEIMGRKNLIKWEKKSGFFYFNL